MIIGSLSYIVVGCLPDLAPVEKVVWLEQNWTSEQQQWFHNTSQGTETIPIPYEWFMALEQPDTCWGLNPFCKPKLLADSDYLALLGFIPGEVSRYNQAGLPVGFSVEYGVTTQSMDKPVNLIGFTCAACHTGQMTYKGTAIRYDGGPAMTNLTAFTSKQFLSMFETKYSPRHFKRFAARVLGEENTEKNRQALKKAFSKVFLALIKQQFQVIEVQVLEQILADIETGQESKILSNIASVAKANLQNIEGYTRLDALNRIGNTVFSVDAEKPQNYVPVNAPVNYPHIWTASWFDWVQYDGSIMQPMIRNAGEALGGSAYVDLNGQSSKQFNSSLPVDNIYKIEQLLAGSNPFSQKSFNGLKAPQWPEDILGKIDQAKAAQGEQLYQKHCQSCHFPATTSEAFWTEKYWSMTNQANERLLNLKVIDLDTIGTDPGQATIIQTRTVDIEGMNLDTVVYAEDKEGKCKEMRVNSNEEGSKNQLFAFALGAVVQETVNYWYIQHNIPPAERQKMNGNRINCLRALAGYKARPLNGIWATAPYLHNGSVPSLFDLLSPVAERPSTFYLGHLEFDPIKVGYITEKEDGLTFLDTKKTGNLNTGHEFNSGTGKGIIGPRLSVEERKALVEYLKTL